MNENELLKSMNDLFVTAFPFVLKHDDDYIIEVDVIKRHPVSKNKGDEYSSLFFKKGYLFFKVIVREIDCAIAQEFPFGNWKDVKTFDRFEIFFSCLEKPYSRSKGT